MPQIQAATASRTAWLRPRTAAPYGSEQTVRCVAPIHNPSNGHVTIAAVTIFPHRHQTHRAPPLHPAAGHFFRFWLWLTTVMATKEWVSVHRKHHARSDTAEDPHSPSMESGRCCSRAELYRIEIAKATPAVLRLTITHPGLSCCHGLR